MYLSDKKLQYLKNRALQFEDLDDAYLATYHIEGYSDSDEEELCIDIEDENILKLLNNNICSFKEIVDRVKKMKEVSFNDQTACYFNSLLDKHRLFENLIENEKLTNNDLRDLLNEIDDLYGLCNFCQNSSLIKKVLNEFLLNKKNIDRFNKIVENSGWYDERNIHTVFDLLEDFYKTDQKLLKLNKLNRGLCDIKFDIDQKLKLVDVLKNNEKAQNMLMSFTEANVHDQYDFEQLKNMLTKDREKKKGKINL